MTPEDTMLMAVIGKLLCGLALAALAWPWYRRVVAESKQDWRGEGGTDGER